MDVAYVLKAWGTFTMILDHRAELSATSAASWMSRIVRNSRGIVEAARLELVTSTKPETFVVRLKLGNARPTTEQIATLLALVNPMYHIGVEATVKVIRDGRQHVDTEVTLTPAEGDALRGRDRTFSGEGDVVRLRKIDVVDRAMLADGNIIFSFAQPPTSSEIAQNAVREVCKRLGWYLLNIKFIDPDRTAGLHPRYDHRLQA